jgi:hypothetical protein
MLVVIFQIHQQKPYISAFMSAFNIKTDIYFCRNRLVPLSIYLMFNSAKRPLLTPKQTVTPGTGYISNNINFCLSYVSLLSPMNVNMICNSNFS